MSTHTLTPESLRKMDAGTTPGQNCIYVHLNRDGAVLPILAIHRHEATGHAGDPELEVGQPHVNARERLPAECGYGLLIGTRTSTA